MISQYISMLRTFSEVHLASLFTPEGIDPLGRVDSHIDLKKPRKMDIVLSFLRSPKAPLQCHLFNGREARARLRLAIGKIQPDVIIFDMVRLVEFARNFKKLRLPLIVDLDDLLSFRYRRMRDNRKMVLAGSFQDKIPGFLQKFAALFPKRILRLEEYLVSRQEARLGGIFSGVIMVSSYEADLLRQKLIAWTPVLTAPPAAGTFSQVTVKPGKEREFFFLGNATTNANARSLEWFDEIAGKVIERTGGAIKFISFGKRNADLQLKHVQTRGFVENLDDELHGRSILLASMATGSGVKIKVLEAMARGIPVISSDIGVEGTSLDDRHFLRCNTTEEFVRTIVDILENTIDEQELNDTAKRAFEAIYEDHGYSKIARDLENFIRKIAGTNSASPERKTAAARAA